MGLTLIKNGTNFWQLVGLTFGNQWDSLLAINGTHFWQSMGLTFGNQWDYITKTILMTESQAKRESRMMAQHIFNIQ